MKLIEEYRRYAPRRLTWLAKGRRGALQTRLESSIRLPKLPIRRPRPGVVWGVTVVKNEADVIGSTLTHLLEQGVDALVVVDHGSSDGTADVIADLARDHPIYPGLDTEPAWYQGRKISYLAHLAWRAGAEWVVPFDADEHWYARGSTLTEQLRATSAPVVHAAIHDVLPAPGRTLLDVTSDDVVRVDALATQDVKVAFRAASGLDVYEGNHEVHRPGERVDGLYLLHYQWRSLEQLTRKVTQGSAALRATDLEAVGAHWLRLSEWDRERITAYWNDVLPAENVHGLPRRLVNVANPWRTWQSWDPGNVLTLPEPL